MIDVDFNCPYLSVARRENSSVVALPGSGLSESLLMPMPVLHPLKRRLLAEELTRLRRADEQQRFAASQRRGRIDPNPHQIDAVVFALKRIPDGGCILADEVGLGKTIEAGLVIAQLLAEGMRRILLIVPKSLLGQWQTELYSLFGIETREGRPDPEAFAGEGVFLVHREFAGGLRGGVDAAGQTVQAGGDRRAGDLRGGEVDAT